MTARPDFFKHLATVGEELNVPIDRRTVVYRGTETFSTKNGRYLTADAYRGDPSTSL
ncbi:ATPase AAA [Bifidobacterium parmae]|uniref:ATPase AAA n=1 Tax=Bifidobacterium parmae TaxID=361854 RepID=A0A2N5J575_9BIFI|nr:ATPase AAA [Bifidobacterium parmae]